MATRDEPARVADLEGRRVLIAVCGGIAAYKVCSVVSALVQRGASVSVAMTEAATKFVGAVTFQALSGNPVLLRLWHAEEGGTIQHISSTESVDLVLVAPATANMIGKMSCGIADDLVSTLLIGASAPVVLAPAMNNQMWANPIVQRNFASLREVGYGFIEPEEGWLACRSVGSGRMAEPETIVEAIVARLGAT